MNTSKSTSIDLTEANSDGMNRGVMIMIISVACFTVNALLLRYLGAVRTINPSVALLFRAVVGAVIVLLFFRSRRPLEIVPIFRDRDLIGRGITGIFGTAAYYMTVPTLGAGKATILCNTYVLFAVLIAAVAIGESLRRATFGWIALAFVGIILLTGLNGGSADMVRPRGVDEAIAVIGALFAASTVVLIRKLTIRYSNGTIFMTQCLWVGIAALPFAIPLLKNLNAWDAFYLIAAGSAAGVGQILMNEGYRRLSVAVGSSIQMGWPLMTAIGGFAFFGERLTPLQIFGAGLILFGIFKVKANPK